MGSFSRRAQLHEWVSEWLLIYCLLIAFIRTHPHPWLVFLLLCRTRLIPSFRFRVNCYWLLPGEWNLVPRLVGPMTISSVSPWPMIGSSLMVLVLASTAIISSGFTTFPATSYCCILLINGHVILSGHSGTHMHAHTDTPQLDPMQCIEKYLMVNWMSAREPKLMPRNRPRQPTLNLCLLGIQNRLLALPDALWNLHFQH
jgi:hypothetical protein